MKIAICFYSGTGNTQLACHYLANRLQAKQVDLINALDPRPINLAGYDAVGFATATHFMGLPVFFADFLARLDSHPGKPAFALNTYGAMSGQALKLLAKAVEAKGFRLIGGHSLLLPENYPPFIIKGWANLSAPDDKELAAFNRFIAAINNQLDLLEKGETPPPAKIAIGLLNSLMRPGSQAKAVKEMGGAPMLDEERCNGCGACVDNCPHRAIELDPQPVFNANLCQACWRCFNLCPEQAIYTAKIRGQGHYPRPADELTAKLSATPINPV